MTLLFIIGRLHPNLTQWVAAFEQEGWSVSVLVGRESVNRVESVKPRIISPDQIDAKMAASLIDEIQPDLVVIRSKDEGHRRVVKAAKARGAKAIYYDQRSYLRPSGFRALYRELRKAIRRARQGHPRVGITTTRGVGDVPKLWRHWIRVPMPVPESVNSRDYFREGVPSILLVGRLANDKKRHLWVLQALEEFGGPYRLVVAGAGDDSHTAPEKRSRDYYDEVRRTLSAPSVSDRVTLMEDVLHEEMPALYRQADIFVLPSRQELLGISIIEAMSQGCAVIASSGAGATGYMTDETDGLVFPRDKYEEFRDRLHVLLRNPGRAQELGKAAADTIRNRHRHADFVSHIRQIAKL